MLVINTVVFFPGRETKVTCSSFVKSILSSGKITNFVMKWKVINSLSEVLKYLRKKTVTNIVRSLEDMTLLFANSKTG